MTSEMSDDVCSTVRDLAGRPQDASELMTWRRHRSRDVHQNGMCFTCWRTREAGKRKDQARKARAARVEKTYGLTREQHEELYRLQGGRCPHGRKITLRSPVDHDHTSGAVRGLMCDPCNRFLGYVGDRPEAFLNLWAYAARPPAIVPRVSDHQFLTYPGLVQCTWHPSPHDLSARCGRLENEHVMTT